jgi:hypothetical protein
MTIYHGVFHGSQHQRQQQGHPERTQGFARPAHDPASLVKPGRWLD